MTDKMRLMHKVWYSDLNATQKALLTYLISKADAKGVAWPTVATLCKVAGIKHEKNFKVDKHLEGFVTVQKRRTKDGIQNEYLLSTPAIEGLPEAEVVLKNTERRGTTPSSAGVTTPSTAVTTPSDAGVTTPSTEGTERTVDRTRERTEERTTTPAAPVANQEEEASPSPLSTTDAEEPLIEDQTDLEEYQNLEPYQQRLYRTARAMDPLGFDHEEQMKKYNNPDYSDEW
jgi:hypothetical protein